MVTLHIILVDAIVLEIDEDAVNQTDPECRLRQVERELTQRELIARWGVDGKIKSLHRSLWHPEEQETKAKDGTADEDYALNGIGPDDCSQTAQHGIDNDTDGGQDYYHVNVPTHEDIHRYCQQIENRSHAGNLRQKITCRSIQPGPGTELLLQKGIG